MENQVLLVTGSSSGIGKATAELLNEHGYIVYGVARQLDKMNDLKRKGVRVRSVDVTEDDQLIGVINEIITEHGRIDGLINNAGANLYGSLEEIPVSEAKALFDLNVFAYVRAAQLVLPHMRKRGSGYIINVGSVAGIIVIPTLGWYCASKFAIEAVTDSLRMEVRNLGIKVVLIEPEIIETNIGSRGLESSKRYAPVEDYGFLNSMWEIIVPDSMAKAASPKLVARVILKVLQARRTKYRYFVPSYSRLISVLKRILPESWIDLLTLRILKLKSR